MAKCICETAKHYETKMWWLQQAKCKNVRRSYQKNQHEWSQIHMTRWGHMNSYKAHSCAFQPHRNMGIWSKKSSSAMLVVFCLNYPPTEHCCKDPIYGFSACLQTLPCTDHVMLSKRRPKNNHTKSKFLCQGYQICRPPMRWKQAGVTSQSFRFTLNSMCIGEFSLHRCLAVFLESDSFLLF